MSRLIEQFIRFALVGAACTALHFAVLHLLVAGAGLSAWLASSLGAVCGAVLNYLIARTWVFASSEAHHRAMPRFAGVFVVSLGLNAGLMAVLADTLQWHHLMAQAVTTGLVLVWNYLGHRTWTFPNRSLHNPR